MLIGTVYGDVDSTVAAVLMREAFDDRFHDLFPDSRVLRKNESAEVIDRLADCWGASLNVIEAVQVF